MTKTVKALVVPFFLLLLAELAAHLSPTTSDALSPPSAVVLALVRAFGDGSLLVATGDTLIAALGGLFIGAAIGLLLGILLGLVPLLGKATYLSIEVLRPIPSVALLPIAMLVFGFGYRMEIAIVAFSCLWPMLILTRAAFFGVEPRLLEVSRALGLNVLARVWKIILPASLPRIIVAFRLAAGIALVVAVTVEIAVNPLGLGYGILVAQQALRPDLMLAYLLWVGIVGYAFNGCLSYLQRHLGRAALPGTTLR